MVEKILAILECDIKDLETVDFGFNNLFLDSYYTLKERIKNAENKVLEAIERDMEIFMELNNREEHRSSYYGNKLSLYLMSLDSLVQ